MRPAALIAGGLLLCAVLAASPLRAGDKLPESVKKALGASSRKSSVSQLERSIESAPEADLAWIHLYIGESRRLLGHDDQARAHFEEVAGKWPGSGARDAAVLGMAVVDAKGVAGGNVLATLVLIADRGVPDTLNADRYLLITRARVAEHASSDEIRRAARKAERYASTDPEVSARVATALDPVLRDGGEPPAAERSGAGGGGDPADPPDLAAIRRIRDAGSAGRWDAIPPLVAEFSVRFPDSPFAREAGYASRRAAAKVPADLATVAVLLPLSGTYALPGGNLRAAIELGNQHAGGRLRLVFHDTEGKAESCVRELEEAVITEGAAFVIGPLLKDEALQCAGAAQALRVPMLTLTSSEEVLAAGDHVFRAFPSTEQQVEVLLGETYDVRGLTRYAILHPSTPFGENAARAFDAAVVARGGSVSVSQSYTAEQKDFRTTARTLGRKDPKAQASELARLRARAEASGSDPKKVVLPPMIDYQAIFVPDAYGRVALLASALAFEEFPVGKFRPQRDMTPLPLLGLNAWNNDDFARRGGAYVQDSIFVDAFNPRSDDSETVSFVSAWRDRGLGDPGIVEAVGYDTARLVAVAAAAGAPDAMTALRAATLAEPVAGTRSFGEDRQMRRDWLLLTVTRSGIAPLQPPEPGIPEPAPPEP